MKLFGRRRDVGMVKVTAITPVQLLDGTLALMVTTQNGNAALTLTDIQARTLVDGLVGLLP